MNMTLFYAAIVIMLIVILRDYLKKRYGFDMDNVDGNKLKLKYNAVVKLIRKKITQLKPVNSTNTIRRTSGVNKLILLDAGVNKATVMATLRQITGVDYNTAKNMVEVLPSEILSNTSDKEATLTKKALEFVGATLEIR